jgi:hypothetical protein
VPEPSSPARRRPVVAPQLPRCGGTDPKVGCPDGTPFLRRRRKLISCKLWQRARARARRVEIQDSRSVAACCETRSNNRVVLLSDKTRTLHDGTCSGSLASGPRMALASRGRVLRRCAAGGDFDTSLQAGLPATDLEVSRRGGVRRRATDANEKRRCRSSRARRPLLVDDRCGSSRATKASSAGFRVETAHLPPRGD